MDLTGQAFTEIAAKYASTQNMYVSTQNIPFWNVKPCILIVRECQGFAGTCSVTVWVA